MTDDLVTSALKKSATELDGVGIEQFSIELLAMVDHDLVGDDDPMIRRKLEKKVYDRLLEFMREMSQ